MENLFAEIYRRLRSGKKTVTAVIVAHRGSTPRKVGTRCLVTEDKAIMGTVGGGLLEYEVIEAAMAVFQSGRSRILNFNLTGKEAAETTMICGGEVTVYLEPVFPGNPEMLKLYEKIDSILAKDGEGILFTRVKSDIPAIDSDSRALLTRDDDIYGSAPLIPKEMAAARPADEIFKPAGLIEPETGDDPAALFMEPVRPGEVLYIFGAGHVSTHICSLASLVGFQVTVIDDRQELLTRDRFPLAQKKIIASFGGVFDQIKINRSSYLVIVTRGHLHDKEVLKAALETSPAYIGMIGSKRKRAILYKTLMDEGVAKTRLNRVYSPIGLDIGAETPEEIAVSIVAELIKVRRDLHKASVPPPPEGS